MTKKKDHRDSTSQTLMIHVLMLNRGGPTPHFKITQMVSIAKYKVHVEIITNLLMKKPIIRLLWMMMKKMGLL